MFSFGLLFHRCVKFKSCNGHLNIILYSKQIPDKIVFIKTLILFMFVGGTWHKTCDKSKLMINKWHTNTKLETEKYAAQKHGLWSAVICFGTWPVTLSWPCLYGLCYLLNASQINTFIPFKELICFLSLKINKKQMTNSYYNNEIFLIFSVRGTHDNNRHWYIRLMNI